MKHFDVLVTVHGATPPRGNAVTGIGYIVKTDTPEDAKQKALDCAKLTQLQHPRKYKNATFSVDDENIKEFKF